MVKCVELQKLSQFCLTIFLHLKRVIAIILLILVGILCLEKCGAKMHLLNTCTIAPLYLDHWLTKCQTLIEYRMAEYSERWNFSNSTGIVFKHVYFAAYLPLIASWYVQLQEEIILFQLHPFTARDMSHILWIWKIDIELQTCICKGCCSRGKSIQRYWIRSAKWSKKAKDGDE